MISTITSSFFGALIVLGVIIVLHELGHFLVAKFFKIKVETFSVGFGPRLFGFRYGETDYRVSAFPLGGYVKMAGENPTDNITGDPREFLSKPKWQRFLVALAGPAMNVILAVGLMTGYYMYGSEIFEYQTKPADVGVVEPDSAAAQAGIQPGDRIVSIAGKENPTWQDVESRIMTNPNQTLAVRLERGGRIVDASLKPRPATENMATGPTEIGQAGMCPYIPVVIKRIEPGYPAESAGLVVGDEIVAVNGVSLKSACRTIQERIQATSDATFPLTIVRNGEHKEVQVTPVKDNGRKVIGIDISIPMTTVQSGLGAAFSKSIETNVYQATLMFQVIGRLFRREASLDQLAGPIGIVRISGQAFDLGAGPLIYLMAFISLNLGVINLLPIPILDGGVMLLLLIEGLMRRDLSLRVKERIVQVGFVFLLVLMVFVIYNDVLKLMPSRP